jgi:DNA-binding transcriptional LysR family regulator
MSIYALYTSRKHLPPAVRAFLDFLVDRFARVPW